MPDFCWQKELRTTEGHNPMKKQCYNYENI